MELFVIFMAHWRVPRHNDLLFYEIAGLKLFFSTKKKEDKFFFKQFIRSWSESMWKDINIFKIHWRLHRKSIKNILMCELWFTLRLYYLSSSIENVKRWWVVTQVSLNSMYPSTLVLSVHQSIVVQLLLFFFT